MQETEIGFMYFLTTNLSHACKEVHVRGYQVASGKINHKNAIKS